MVSDVLRDLVGLLGLCLLTTGVCLLSVPWGLIVLGSLLFGVSVWGYLRDDPENAPGPE